MTVQVSYMDFHLVFVLPVLAVLSVATYRRRPLTGVQGLGLGIMIVAALGYTTPWDNYLILQDVWGYGEGTVFGRIWVAPIEEYLFIVLQSVVAGLWVYRVAPDSAPSFEISVAGRVAGAAAGCAVGGVGAILLGSDTTFYMGAILAWAGPVLALQWGFGWPYLLRVRRRFAAAVLAPTLYFAAADRVAIELGIWSLSSVKTTGITVAGLPIEEGAFFFMTNVFLAQGLLLYQWLYERRLGVDS